MATAQPVIDSGIRGMIAASGFGLLSFLGAKTDWLTTEDIGYLMPTIIFLSFVIGGFYDAYIRPRLRPPSSGTTPGS